MRSWLGSLLSDHLAQEWLNWPPGEDGAMIFWSMRSRMAWPVLWVLHGIVGVFLVHWEIWWWTNWAFFELILQQLGLIHVDFWLFFVKQALLSIFSTILLHVLRLISSMDREFQTWALFHKISWVNHWIWGSDWTSSKIIRDGNSGLWALIQIGSCETQVLGLEFHSRK